MKRRMRRIHFRVHGLSDPGRVRENNEDNFVIRKELGFFAVADGMGGHAGGEIASRMAIDEGQRAVHNAWNEGGLEDTWDESRTPKADEDKMREIFQKANTAIHSKNAANPAAEKGGKRAKMGTTFVCAKILGQKIYVANTGDSRFYLIRNGSMQKLTEDHSVVEEMVQAGKLKDDNAAGARKIRDYITACLGTKADVEADVVAFIPRKGDIYLLCSDGLTKMVSEEKILNIVNVEKEIKKGCHLLVSLANELGGRDNITVVMVQITGVGISGPRKSARDEEAPGPEDTLVEF